MTARPSTRWAPRIDALRASIEQSGVPGLRRRRRPADRGRHRALRLGARPRRRAAPRHRPVRRVAGGARRRAGRAPCCWPTGCTRSRWPSGCERSWRRAPTTLGEHAGQVELVEAVRRRRAGAARRSAGGDEHAALADPADRRAGDARARRRRRRPRRSRAPTPSRGARRRPTIIPLTSIGRRRTTRWTELPAAAALADGDVAAGRRTTAWRSSPAASATTSTSPATRSPTNSLRIVATDPPTVEAGDGTRFALLTSTPLAPTHARRRRRSRCCS